MCRGLQTQIARGQLTQALCAIGHKNKLKTQRRRKHKHKIKLKQGNSGTGKDWVAAAVPRAHIKFALLQTRQSAIRAEESCLQAIMAAMAAKDCL